MRNPFKRESKEADTIELRNAQTGAPIHVSASMRKKNNMRNQQCLCQSGRKFKKCCWSKFK